MDDIQCGRVLPRDAFIEELKAEVLENGYSVVPLIGSGISHGSGIMIGSALGEYLAYVIWRLIAGYEHSKSGTHHTSSLVDQGWPNPPSQRERKIVNEWVTSYYCSLLDRHRIGPDVLHRFNLNNLHQPLGTIYRIAPMKPLAFDRNTFENYAWKNPQNKMSEERLDAINQSIRDLNMYHMQFSREDVFSPLEGVSRSSRRYIVETAIRSLYDWRLALHFISRLKKAGDLILLADQSDHFIIDSFNIFITQGRKPCLAHQMMSFLTRPLRIKKLLTTNFDTLLEEAYASLDVPLQVFPIEINSPLPDPSSISLKKSLIKLHGSLHETRADFSLDSPPDSRDKEVFLRYLCPDIDNIPSALPSHLLVMGTSLPDKRNIELIKHVCDRSASFKIFVIAFNTSTIRHIQASFGSEYSDHLIFTKSSLLDLTLYEMYQKFTYSLPPSGFKFEFSQYVPPFEDDKEFFPKSLTLSDGRKSRTVVFSEASEFREKISTEIFDETIKKSCFLIIDGKCSVTKTGATIFYCMQNIIGKSCIWLELEDFIHPNHMLSEIFRTISIRFGLYQTESINLEFPSDEGDDYLERKIRVLVQHYGIDPRSWCLFIYGRNVAGSCAGYCEATIADAKTDGDWEEREFARLRNVLNCLSQQEFKVVYMPLSRLKAQSQADIELNPAVSGLLQRNDVQHLFGKASSYIKIDDQLDQPANSVTITVQDEPDFGLKNTIENLIFHYLCDANEEVIKDRLRLIYSATLFRQSRHVSALFSESAFRSRGRYDRFINNHPTRRSSDRNGLHDLEKHAITEQAKILSEKKIRFFNTKPGGLMWMFRDVRLLANALTDREPETSKNPTSPTPRKNKSNNEEHQRDMRRLRTRMHFWIGQWYMRAFYSSNHVDPLKEAIFHTLMAIKYVQFASLDKNSLKYRETLLVAGLATLAKIIIISRESLRFWIAEHRSAKIFYWRSIKKGMDIKFSVSKLTADEKHSNNHSIEQSNDQFAEQPNTLTTYIKQRITPPDEHDKYEPTESYKKLISDLIFDIRNECFKLERDILRYSNYHPGMQNPANDCTSVVIIPFSGTAAKMIVAEIEPFIAYEPGAKWHDVYETIIKNSRESIGGAIRVLKYMTLNYLDANDCPPESRIRDISSRIRAFKHEYSIYFLENPQDLSIFVQMATEFVYRIIRQAKFENRCLCIKKQATEPKSPQGAEFVDTGSVEFSHSLTEAQLRVDRYWQLVGLISQSLLELSQQLPSSYLLLESELKAKLLTFSGLSLGRLGKFLDAHQTLNEATGIVYNMPMYDSRRETVILRMRRAEVHLLEAIKLNHKLFHQSRKLGDDACNSDLEFSRLLRLHIAKLDDAWTLMEEVESLMPDCMHSALWCGKLYYIRLMIFSECYIMNRKQGRMTYIPRIMRNLENSAGYLFKNIELGVLSCGDDAYRKLCFLNVFAKAAKKYKNLLDNVIPERSTEFWKKFHTDSQKNFAKFTFGDTESSTHFKHGDSWQEILPFGKHSGQAISVEDSQLSELIAGVAANFDKVLPLGTST